MSNKTPLKTTCIGAFPKPDYVPIHDWFGVNEGMTSQGYEVTELYTEAMKNADKKTEALFDKATHAAIADQVACGIDIPTDGEQRRENYVHYQCRHLEGFDFDNLTHRVLRDGAYETRLPTIRGQIKHGTAHFLDHDYRVAQAATDKPVKITVPGPLTITDTTANEFYDDRAALARDLADALNYEIKALAEAGCKYIQLDEPLFARNVQGALDYGVECLDRCFHGVPADVTRVMHMCCGYPNHLDDVTYHKADQSCYFDLAEAVDNSSVHQISVEDCHRHNDLSLYEKFQNSTVIFGSVAIAKSHIENVDEIMDRLNSALGHIDRDRLVVAPDCGLGFLGRDLAMKKLTNMCKAAKYV